MYNRPELREQTIHGEPDFPVSVYYNPCNKEQILVHHWHLEMEFIYVISGDTVFYIDTEPVRLKAGEAAFVRGGQIHGGRAQGDNPSEFYSIVFHPSVLLSNMLGPSRVRYAEPFAENHLSLPTRLGDDGFGQYATGKLKEIVEAYFSDQSGREISILASLYAVIGKAAACGILTPSRDKPSHLDQYKRDRLRKTIEYIRLHYAEKITVGDMAAHLCVSQYYFCHFFRQLCQTTPMEYVNLYRIERASKLLVETDAKILDISMDCGFQNVSYFIRRFRAVKGCTPSEYRKREPI